MTLEGKIAYRSLLQLQAGVTMQKAEYKQARAWSDDETVPMEKKMFRTPNTYGYFTLSYNPFVPMTIALSGTYTGSMMVEHKAGFIDKDIAVNTPDFFELNLLEYIISLMRIKVTLTGGQNVIPVTFMDRVCRVLTLPE